jgi:FkbM family methyltransferase
MDMATVQGGAVSGEVFVSPAAQIVRTVVHGVPVLFTVANPRDKIQRVHLTGAFYEAEELDLIARHFRLGGTFLDIGANVGNHALYVATFLHAARVVCLEPNPAAVTILRSNIALNGLGHVIDGSYLGYGLSDKATDTAAMAVPPRNLGGGRIVEGEGTIRLARADDLLAGQHVDFIKIDVEGMEMAVLAGMAELVRACRPKMFVEVDNENIEAFRAWVAQSDYRVLDKFKRYRVNVNFLIGPKG